MRTWHIHKQCSHWVPKAWCQMVGNAGYTFKTKKNIILEERIQTTNYDSIFAQFRGCVFFKVTMCDCHVSNPLTIFYRYPGGLHWVQSAFFACWARFSAHRHSSLVDKVAGHQQQSGNSSQHGRTHDQHSKRGLETANSVVKTTSQQLFTITYSTEHIVECCDI